MFRQINILFLLALTVIMALTGCRKSDFSIEPDSFIIRDNGEGIGNITLEKGKNYILEGKVFVNDGQVLTIAPGAVIRFRRGQGAAASALIVARGGKIMADGTAVNPIIFTAEGDDLNGSISEMSTGLWGGIIILGTATINTPTGESHVEGISLTEDRAVFGGHNDTDNSGILRYVSIRFGGTDLGQDNEINGLTLGGVGSQTVIENVEVFGNADDGIELFGGTVNMKQIVVSYCHDDAIDIDLGYRGKGQFFCLIQQDNAGDKLLEIDGGDEVKTAQPYSLPELYNITGMGRGTELSNKTISFQDNAGGSIVNSIFINQSKGVELEFSALRMNSYTQFKNGQLNLRSLIFYSINNNQAKAMFHLTPINDEEVSEQQSGLDDYFSQANNRIIDPLFKTNSTGISFVSESSALKENISDLPTNSDFFENAPYIGAFGSYNWVGEWTLTNQLGLVW